MNDKVIVVGLTRSGTTFVTNLLAKTGEFNVEIEPHPLWKSGNFKFLNDEEYNVSDKITSRIRKVLTTELKGKRLLEKSPINAIRPHLVHKAFPDARIVYIERDPVRCINSNYVRSIKNDSFKPSITLRKYFYKAGGDQGLDSAVSKRTIFSQLTIGDMFFFFRYVIYMVLLRTVFPKRFPFGPKLKNFHSFIKKHGVLAYHVKVYKLASDFKETYKDLYKDQIQFFKLEQLMVDAKELKALYDWAEVEYTDDDIQNTISAVDKKRINQATSTSKIDESILELLNSTNSANSETD